MRSTDEPIDDDEQREAEQAAAEERRRQQVEDFKWIMAHPAGRRFICRLLDESGVFRTAFHTNGSTMALQEGRKQIGYLLTGELMEVTPEGYIKLLKEYGT